VAFATNESDYKYGYDWAYGFYKCGVNPHDECGLPDSDNINWECNATIHHQITNSTACIDGYYNGFIDWCHGDKAACGRIILGGGMAPKGSDHNEGIIYYHNVNGD
jgi:hypothetical protein